MPRSLARLSASELSHRDLSSVVFITNIAESDFRYTQGLRKLRMPSKAASEAEGLLVLADMKGWPLGCLRQLSPPPEWSDGTNAQRWT